MQACRSISKIKTHMRIALSTLLLFMTPQATFGETSYYVDATHGNNSNPGTESSPFRTIQGAASVMASGDKCIVKAGTYREQVTPTSNNVTFRAAEGETVVISAYEHITVWTVHSNNIYKADLAWDDLGDSNQVLYNQQMMNLARWPNKTNYDPFDIQAVRSTSGTNSRISNSGIPAWNWANGGVVWYLGVNRWTSWRQPITSSAAGVINFNTLSADWQYGGSHSPTSGGEMILLNILEALDSPGEWFIDRTANRVYLQTPNGENPDEGTALVRRRTNVFNLNGRTGVKLHGLQIEGGNVDLRGANSCIVENCRIRFGNHTIASTSAAFVGQSSISLNSSSVNNTIRQNDIQWGASSGIAVSGTNNLITNNHIGNFNYLGSYAAPVEVSGTNHNLTRNHIFNGGRDLIRSGGVNDSNISYNDLHHSSLINDDCGAIYFCCNTYNFTRIHHNWIYDCKSRNENVNSYKSVGIYLDNSTKQVIVNHNVIWDIEWSCIQINWEGTDLLLFNNTLWSNSGPNSRSMDQWANGFSFSNVPVWNTLANQNTYRTTDLSNTCTLTLTVNPFEDFSNRNFTPKTGTCPIDAGRVVSPYTDGFVGTAPDIGAYERGAIPWVAGTDWALNVGDSTWNGISGNWSDTTNPGGVWSGGIPANLPDSTAFFTGVDIVADQVINLDAARTIGNITFDDATISSNNLTISGASILTLDRTSGVPIIDVTQTGRTLTIASQISGADGLQKNGTGTLRLSGANNYAGITVVNGPLHISHNNALGSTAVGSHTTIAATGTPGTGANLVVNAGISTAENITITGSTETTGNFSPVISGTGTLTGTITLSSPSGGIRFNGVTFEGTITQSSGTGRNVALNGVTLNNTLSLNGGQVQVLGGTTKLNSALGGTAATTVIAQSGVLVLGANNALHTNQNLSVGTFADTDQGTFRLNGFNQTINGLTSLSSTAQTGSRIVSNGHASTASTLTVGNGNATSTFNGTLIDGSTAVLTLVKTGTGSQTFIGSNTYSGTTTISNGNLVLGNALSMQNSALNTTASVSGTTTADLRTTVTTLTLGGLIGNKNFASSGGVFDTNDGGYGSVTALILNPGAGASHSYSGVIANGASGMTLTKTGAGTQTLAGNNTYTGVTRVNAGTLQLGANNVIPNTSNVTIGTATLDADSRKCTMGTLDVTGAAVINLGISATLVFADSKAVDWSGGTLNITGTLEATSLRFGNSADDLTSGPGGQLAKITSMAVDPAPTSLMRTATSSPATPINTGQNPMSPSMPIPTMTA